MGSTHGAYKAAKANRSFLDDFSHLPPGLLTQGPWLDPGETSWARLDCPHRTRDCRLPSGQRWDWWVALQADRDWSLKESPSGTPPHVAAFLEPSHCPSSTLCGWVERHTCQSCQVYLSVFCCFSFWSLRGTGDGA